MEPVFAPRLPRIEIARRSPNFGQRAAGFERPTCLVLHYTGMRDGPAAIDWLCDPASQVSCHYVVTEMGAILQLVDEQDRAWCCGRSFWHGVTDLNSASINIEIVNGGHDFGLPPYPEAQIAGVVALSRDILERHDIPPERVLAHSDIAPSRKQDPGERFPWSRLAAQGVGVWPEARASVSVAADLSPGQSGPAVERLQADLARYGYGLAVTGQYDAETTVVVRAFQRHFRPRRVDGFADVETLQCLDALLEQTSI